MNFSKRTSPFHPSNERLEYGSFSTIARIAFFSSSTFEKIDSFLSQHQVITFSDFNTNYGSMLQAFSLKSFLEGRGHEVEFIRYREFNRPLRTSFISNSKQMVKKVLLKMYKRLKYRDVKKTRENFEAFKETYFNHTELCSEESDFERLKI